ncbi:MAG: protein-disulfide reductase DsbD domain-containing protein [Opitutales bacterium]
MSLLLASSAPGALSAAGGAAQPVRAELLSEAVQVRAGDKVRVGVRFEIEPGWHIYGEDAGFAGLPTRVDWDLPEGMAVGALSYPPDALFVVGGEEGYGYENDVFLVATLTIPEGIDLGEIVSFSARVSWLASSDVHIAGEEVFSLDLPVGEEIVLSDTYAGLFGSPEGSVAGDASGGMRLPSFAVILLFGFIGGFLLNLMPCVLPVIGIKVMAIVKHSGDSPRALLAQGWVFTAGVVVSFWILAAVVILLQALGQNLGQGFQFQYLPFLVAITSLIFVLGLSMLGVFMIDLGSRGYQATQSLTGAQGLKGAFFNGFLVTTLATPCTAPFLGTAMGFAFTQPAFVTFLIFTSVGFGLAFPFTLLAHKPEWMRYLPKPGPWMEYFKQGMGFLMLGTTVWLLYVINLSRGGDAVVWTVAFLLVLGVASWIYGTFNSGGKSLQVRRRARIAVVAVLLVGVFGILEGQLGWRTTEMVSARGGASGSNSDGRDGVEWVDFSVETFEDLLAGDSPLFLNFTAAWCISCKANEHTSIEIEATRQKLDEIGAVALYGDWTNQNAEISDFLRSFGRAGVPFYLVYGKDRSNPEILPALLTPGIMRGALERAAASFEDEDEDGDGADDIAAASLPPHGTIR